MAENDTQKSPLFDEKTLDTEIEEVTKGLAMINTRENELKKALDQTVANRIANQGVQQYLLQLKEQQKCQKTEQKKNTADR